MTRHLMRLLWNRKRANFLILVEIFCSFLVLFAVVVLVLQLANNYRQPLGYAIDNAWAIGADTKTPENDDTPKEAKLARRAALERLLAGVRELPQVESACAAFTGPYITSGWGTGFSRNGRLVRYALNPMTDGCQDVFRMSLVRGRWPGRQDDGAAMMPVVINERLAREVFGAEDPVDRTFPWDDHETPRRDGRPHERYKVVGVIQDFRQDGELSTPENYMLRRISLAEPDGHFPGQILVRLRPGTTAAFEETLVARLRAIAPDWSFETRTFDLLRKDNLRQRLQPMLAMAVVAGFLLLMVALGLTGVVWQNITQRTREIGLRRAKGATILNIRHQVLGELALMTGLAVLVGAALVAQLPLLPLPEMLAVIPGYVFAAALGLSVVAMFMLTLGCAWYPSRLATRIQPADALHYE